MSSLKGYLYGLVGVMCFSLTLPATRIAVMDIDPTIVGFGRAVFAAALAFFALWIGREKIPAKKHWGSIAVVTLGAVLGFPLLTTLAMAHTDASHGAVVLGLLPLSTAIFAVIICRERPSLAFWVASVIGALLVVGYTLQKSQGAIIIYDLLLFAAVFLVGLAYAVGGQLAKSLGSWQVICWALLFSVPFTLPILIFELTEKPFNPSFESLMGFTYVSVVSMFLGFFFWYRGLSEGGIAKVGLLQLLQPFMTITASAIFLDEIIESNMIFFTVSVSVVILFALKSKVKYQPMIKPQEEMT